jgi:hypothetical protein
MMPQKHPKRPRDLNQWAKHMLDLATGAIREPSEALKNEAAVELGRRGGLKGGKARAAALSADERKLIARKAARKRWDKTKS